ncbi:unnamed protein product [Trichogramma brassicae]|uniref:Uncharacterized protein n=1 Tax=Trichogramma brassicae TaxID=86971 RepID=A0A6H5HV08_9HYME|nr:unnamed protein product [Trichogramma brassicae]
MIYKQRLCTNDIPCKVRPVIGCRSMYSDESYTTSKSIAGEFQASIQLTEEVFDFDIEDRRLCNVGAPAGHARDAINFETLYFIY